LRAARINDDGKARKSQFHGQTAPTSQRNVLIARNKSVRDSGETFMIWHQVPESCGTGEAAFSHLRTRQQDEATFGFGSVSANPRKQGERSPVQERDR
jgi:hypothetical protein